MKKIIFLIIFYPFFSSAQEYLVEEGEFHSGGKIILEEGEQKGKLKKIILRYSLKVKGIMVIFLGETEEGKMGEDLPIRYFSNEVYEELVLKKEIREKTSVISHGGFDDDGQRIIITPVKKSKGWKLEVWRRDGSEGLKLESSVNHNRSWNYTWRL